MKSKRQLGGSFLGGSISTKDKWCWVAKECGAGWKVYFAIGNYDTKTINFYFQSVEDVEKVLPKGKVVFVHMAKCAVDGHGKHTQ